MENQDQLNPIGSVTLMNSTGDVTIAWDDSNRDKVMAFIQQKMDAKVSFFILEKIPLLPVMYPKRVKKIKNLDGQTSVTMKTKDDKAALAEIAKVVLGDAGAESLVQSGAAAVIPPTKSKADAPVKRATSAEQVYNNRSVAVPRVVGG